MSKTYIPTSATIYTILTLFLLIPCITTCQSSKKTTTTNSPILMIAIQKDGVWTAYDNQYEIIFQNTDTLRDIDNFKSDLALVTLQELDLLSNYKKGVINIKGELLESPKIDSFMVVDVHQTRKNTYFEMSGPSEWGPNRTVFTKKIWVNQAGTSVPSMPYLVLEPLGKDMLIGHNNKIAGWNTPKKWEFWSLQNQKKLFELVADNIGTVKEGLIAFKKSGKWGFIDEKGKVKIQAQFLNIYTESVPDYGYIEGYVEAEVDYVSWVGGSAAAQNEAGKWGMINKKGQWILAPSYTHCLYSGDAHWSFKRADKQWILVNKEGEQTNDIVFTHPLKLYDEIFSYHQLRSETDNTLEIVEAGARKVNGDWVFKHYYEIGWDTIWVKDAKNCGGVFIDEEGLQKNCICKSIQKGIFTDVKGTTSTVNNYATGAFVHHFKRSLFQPIMMGDGYFMFYTGLDLEPVIFNPQGEIITHLGAYENSLSIGHFSNGLAAIRYFNKELNLYQLGFINKKGEWQIKPGIIKCPQEGIDKPARALEGFIYIEVKNQSYLYDFEGKLMRKFDSQDENADWDCYTLLQKIPKAWPRH